MVLNAILVDYLTLTTYSLEDYRVFFSTLKQLETTLKQKTTKDRRMQYNGHSISGGFVGNARQKKRQHWLTEYSGQVAHLAAERLLDSPMREERCTRIDVQITIPKPPEYKSEDLFDALNGNLPYNREVTLYKSGDGMDTVYLGSRKTKNGRYTRIYVKEHATGHGLRFETEFKGAWANEVWINLRTGMTVDEALTMELESLGDLKIEPLATFYGLVKGYLPMPKPKPVETSTPTLDWLLKTVEPAILRMLADHDHGSKVRLWLEGLLDWSQRRD